MREIKFRGKRIDNCEWVYGFYSPLILPIVGNMGHYINEGGYKAVEVDPSTVGEYTGLKDKNGKEIYEGDIVVQDCYLWFDDGIPNYRGTVEWIYSQWQVVAHCVNPNKSGISSGINEGLNDEGFEENENSEWEVIGNIYENPELLGGE